MAQSNNPGLVLRGHLTSRKSQRLPDPAKRRKKNRVEASCTASQRTSWCGTIARKAKNFYLRNIFRTRYWGENVP
ncbi:hypothetical protein X975_06942, partial [Stegodyphus mimosarum]